MPHTLGLADADGLGDNDTEPDGDCEADGLALVLLDGEGERLGVALMEALGEGECDGDRDALGLILAEGEGERDGDNEGLVLVDGEADDDGDSEPDNDADGDNDDNPVPSGVCNTSRHLQATCTTESVIHANSSWSASNLQYFNKLTIRRFVSVGTVAPSVSVSSVVPLNPTTRRNSMLPLK